MPYVTTATLPKTKVRTQTTALVLGIDSGATKTTAGIGDASRLLATGQSGGGNLHTMPPEHVDANLSNAVRKAIKKYGQLVKNFSRIVVGMAGIDSPHDQWHAENLVKRALQPWSNDQTTLTVVNDIHIVRRSGSDATYGLALIAGTGSHCFGINPAGDIAYAGGLEYILADEGSSYDVGLKILRAAVRSADGRSRYTKLQAAVFKHFNIKSVRALEPIVYHSENFGKAEIAQLAKLIGPLAAAGDWRAQEIIKETVTELAAHVEAVMKRLKLETRPFDLVVVGGLFAISDVPFYQKFQDAVKKLAPQANLIRPQEPPVWGAVRLAQEDYWQKGI